MERQLEQKRFVVGLSHNDLFEVIEQKRFAVGLCYDVLFEVLQSGKRRQLATLEGVGRRVHCMIDRNFIVKPFLLLDIKFQLVFFTI